MAMHQPKRLFFFGGTEIDRPFIAAVAARLGLPLVIRRSGLVYRMLDCLPQPLARLRSMRRMAQIISPWVEAIEITLVTGPNDIMLIRNIRTAISYLVACDPLRQSRPEVFLTWFTMKGQPPAKWSAIYHRALLRALRIFVYTPRECITYARWFGVPPSTFSLMVLEAPPIPVLQNLKPPLQAEVIMTGETNRDWATFLNICRHLPHLSFVAVMPAEQAKEMPSLPNLKTLERLPFPDYCELIRCAKIQMILVQDKGVAAGQRDFLLAGRLGVPMIATAVESLQLYAANAEGALFVRQGDVAGACDAINRLLADAGLQTTLSTSLKRRIEEHHSIEMVSSHWANILRSTIRD